MRTSLRVIHRAEVLGNLDGCLRTGEGAVRIILALVLLAGATLAEPVNAGTSAAIDDASETLSLAIGHMEEAGKKVKDATCSFHKQEYKGG